MYVGTCTIWQINIAFNDEKSYIDKKHPMIGNYSRYTNSN